MKRSYKILALVLMSHLYVLSAFAADVTLQWNAVGNATGYRIFYGASSHNYQAPTDVGNKTSHTFPLNPGTYYFAVTAYNNYGESGLSSEVSTSVPEAGVNPPTLVTLEANLLSPQVEGTTVTFTAQAEGGTGPYEYQFWVRQLNGGETMVQDYSPRQSYAWNASTNVNRIGVFARNVGSDAAYEVSAAIPFSTDTNVPTSVRLVSSLESPQPAGTAVTFTAEAEGGSGTYEYQYWTSGMDGDYTMVRDYAPQPQYTWITDSGVAYIWVMARNAGSGEDYQTLTAMPFGTDMDPPTALSITSSLPSPQPAGTTMVFSAQAEGGSGTYEYQFWLCEGRNKWRIAQDYSASSTFTWSTRLGYSKVGVVARNAGSGEAYQQREVFSIKVLRTRDYNFRKIRTADGGSDSLRLSASLPSPQEEGTDVLFTAEAEGGSGTYEYQFWVKPNRGKWELAQDFSPDAAFPWKVSGKYKKVGAVARDTGSDDSYQQTASLQFMSKRKKGRK